jgi:hypothetical protein
VRRARSQAALLLAVLGVLLVGATLVGTCSLLLTTGNRQALAAAAERLGGTGTAADVTVTVGLASDVAATGLQGRAASVDPGAVTAAVHDALAPYPTTTSVWAASETRRLDLPGPVRLGYLLDADTLREPGVATLTAGRWPAAAEAELEVALPEPVAASLGLAPGSAVVLAAPSGMPGADVTVLVVGLVEWSGGPRLARTDAAGRLAVVGPFLVAPGSLADAASGSPVPLSRLSVVSEPELVGSPEALPGAAAAVRDLRPAIQDLVAAGGAPADFVTVRSGLPGFVEAATAEQGRVAALLLAVALVVVVLTVAALGQVARLVAERRAAETALLVDRGAGRVGLARRAALESLALAALATALAVPGAVGVYRALLAGPLAAAWRSASPVPSGPTVVLVVAVAGVALLQVLVAVVASLHGLAASARRRRLGSVARSGLDLALVALAVLGYLQLREHRVGATPVDPVVTAVPVLYLVAGAALALRLLPAVVRLAERSARRSRGLVGPLAAWHVARGRATSGVFLAVLATAATTFGLGFGATWTAAQQDLADAATGADVVVPLDAGPAAAVQAGGATQAGAAGGRVTAVAHRHVGLGSLTGGATLVAVRTDAAGEVLRGRLPAGADWATTTAALTPEAGDALALPPDGAVVVTGTVEPVAGPIGRSLPAIRGDADLSLLLVDPTGGRAVVPLGSVPLDGAPHRLGVGTAAEGWPADGWTGWGAVGVVATLTTASDVPLGLDADVPVTLQVRLPGGGGTGDGNGAGTDDDGNGGGTAGGTADGSEGRGWTVASPFGDSRTGSVRAGGTVARTADGVEVAARVSLFALAATGADVLVTSTPAPDAVPVLVSEDLAHDLDLAPGDELSLGIATTTVPVTVAGSVPYVPAATEGDAVLADVEALARALVARGAFEPVTDGWWVAMPDGSAAAAAPAASVAAGATSRTDVGEDLRTGPLRAALPVVVGLLAAGALVLAVAGAAAQAASAARERTLETARLRGMGVPRAAVVATGLLQHGLVTAGAVAAGGLLGAALTWLVGPVLVSGPTGGPAVPTPVVTWPWVGLAVLVAAVLAGSVLVALPVVVRSAQRADAAALREAA